MKDFIHSTALSIGFDACGIARAEALHEDANFLRSWLNDGQHGDMQYLERNFEKRTDPRVLVPGCKTVIVLLMNYQPPVLQTPDLPKIARYAYPAVDYHTVIKQRLAQLEAALISEYGDSCVAKDYQHSFVDSAPVLERRWAQKAGLGWIGKHTQLIAPGFGSYVFIATLMINLEADEYDSPVPDRCGSCTRCIDACPTSALTPGTLDARKCIAYLTIESKSEIPENLKDKLSGCVVGCDICAEVCPWNKKWAHPHLQEALKPSEAIFEWSHQTWLSASKEQFNAAFRHSAIKRAGLPRIQSVISQNAADKQP